MTYLVPVAIEKRKTHSPAFWLTPFFGAAALLESGLLSSPRVWGPGVESLTVEELVLRDELMEEVKCFMARNNLSSLALKQCGLEGAQAEKLLTLEGAQSEKLTHLDLSRNALGLEGCEGFGRKHHC